MSTQDQVRGVASRRGLRIAARAETVHATQRHLPLLVVRHPSVVHVCGGKALAAAMLSLVVAAAGSTLDRGGGAPAAGSEAVDLPLIHRTPTSFVPPIGHRSTAFLDLVTALTEAYGRRCTLRLPRVRMGTREPPIEPIYQLVHLHNRPPRVPLIGAWKTSGS